MAHQTRKSRELSENELLEFREIFNLVDRDGGGSISNDELGELMDTLGIKATQDEIDMMINEIDEDSNGEVDFEEFVAVMSRKANSIYSKNQVKNSFKVFATGKPTIDGAEIPAGFIHIQKLQDSLLEYKKAEVASEQVRELLAQLPTDQNGLVNYSEYVDIMMAD